MTGDECCNEAERVIAGWATRSEAETGSGERKRADDR